MYENKSLISDWDTLRLVLAIHRHGGVSGAARFLGVTHATVSRRLSRAEATAGTLFFERRPAGLTMTEFGRAVLAQAEQMEPGIDQLERQLIRQDNELSGPLRVTLPPLLMMDDTAQDMAQFAREHPKLELQFVGDNQLANLHQREADIAIRVSHKPPETLWGRKVADQHAGFYAQSEWLQDSAIAKGDLSSELPVISFVHWKTPLPKIIQRFFPKAYVVATCEDMVTAVNLLQAGLGVTRMPRFLGEKLAGVERIDVLPWEPYYPIWMLTHPELRDAPRVKAFMMFIAPRFSKRARHYRVPD